MMEGALLEVAVGVAGLAVDAMLEGAVRVLGELDVKEGDLAALFLFHGELNGWMLPVQVVQEL